jgi:hypothetical protein
MNKELFIISSCVFLIVGLIIYYFYKQGISKGAGQTQKFVNIDSNKTTISNDLAAQLANGVLDEYNKNTWYNDYFDDNTNNSLNALDDEDLKTVYNYFADNIQPSINKSMIACLNSLSSSFLSNLEGINTSQKTVDNIVKRLTGLGAV